MAGLENENWLVNGLTALAAVVVGALVAPARGALVGMAVGALAGAVVAGAAHAIEYAVTGQTSFSVARLGMSILAGAIGGGVRGRVKWANAQKQAAGNVGGAKPNGGGNASRPQSLRSSNAANDVVDPYVAQQPVNGAPKSGDWGDLTIKFRAGKKDQKWMDDLMRGSGQADDLGSNFRPMSQESSVSIPDGSLVRRILENDYSGKLVKARGFEEPMGLAGRYLK